MKNYQRRTIMAKKSILSKEDFIRAWKANGKAKTWGEFARGINKACNDAKSRPLNPANNFKKLHLRCVKIEDVLTKMGVEKSWKRPQRPNNSKSQTIAQILEANPELMPS
jgi:hypothetical protein